MNLGWVLREEEFERLEANTLERVGQLATALNVKAAGRVRPERIAPESASPTEAGQGDGVRLSLSNGGQALADQAGAPPSGAFRPDPPERTASVQSRPAFAAYLGAAATPRADSPGDGIAPLDPNSAPARRGSLFNARA